jgi:RNA polymerase sigma-70 factor (ECF subfamily)
MFEGSAPADMQGLPDEQVERGLRIQAFYRLLDRLSEKKRTVFILHELEGMNPSEISKLVNAPVLTVRTRLFYARRELCAMLGDEPSLSVLAEAFSTEAVQAHVAVAPSSTQKETL